MRLGKDAKTDLLKGVPLFSKLDKKGLQAVALIADELDLPAGKELATEGDRGREFFVLLKGEAEVTKGGQSIATMKEGDFFGEIALVEQDRRTATVRATTPVTAIVMHARDFDAMRGEFPTIASRIHEAVHARSPRHDED